MTEFLTHLFSEGVPFGIFILVVCICLGLVIESMLQDARIVKLENQLRRMK